MRVLVEEREPWLPWEAILEGEVIRETDRQYLVKTKDGEVWYQKDGAYQRCSLIKEDKKGHGEKCERLKSIRKL